MATLALGIAMFLGAHIFTTFRAARARLMDRLGFGPYRAIHSVIALGGLILIAVGFGHYRAGGMIRLWTPLEWMRYAPFVLMWPAFVSLACMTRAPSRIRGWVRHPMLTAVTLWAAGHLIANGDAGGALLFGSFFLWSVYDRIAVTRRGDPGAAGAPAFTKADGVALAAGTAAYAAFIFLHPFLFGVPILG